MQKVASVLYLKGECVQTDNWSSNESARPDQDLGKQRKLDRASDIARDV